MDETDFAKKVLLPKSYSLSLAKAELESPNVAGANAWNVIIGNDKAFSKSFYGSFKDVRLWKSVRSDGELYSHRFRQVGQHSDLQANFKFMDGGL